MNSSSENSNPCLIAFTLWGLASWDVFTAMLDIFNPLGKPYSIWENLQYRKVTAWFSREAELRQVDYR